MALDTTNLLVSDLFGRVKPTEFYLISILAVRLFDLARICRNPFLSISGQLICVAISQGIAKTL
jgi:hypothetical protein